MKASKFSDTQRAFILKQGDDGVPVAEICRKAGISQARAECLNAHWLLTLADSREKLETRRRSYKEDRPHSAIGYNVPTKLHNPCGATSPPS